MTVALAAGLAGCQAASLPTAVALSARFVGEVRIDGAAARMVFDTGCPGTLFERGAAARLGLPAVEAAAVPTLTDAAGHRRRAEGMVLVRDLALGDARCGSFHAPLLPLGGLPGLDGILGMNVLGAFSWIFDVPAGEGVLVAPGMLEGELHRRGLHVEARLPLVLREQAAFVTVHLDGQPVEMHLDSGAATTTLTHRVAAALALPAVASGGSAAVGIHGAPRRQQSFVVARLRLGSCELREVTVCCHQDGDPPMGCMLGADVLGRIRWAVDWSRGEMLLLATGAG
ncbi:MAG: aspartyl protease family protein [Planctomycetes bacterium]|nr:aspartyl protease family protein [Planctomycetota bacterium]